MLSDRDGILRHYLDGHKAATIPRLFQEEGVKASCVRISKFLTKFEETVLIGWRIGSGRLSKINSRNEENS